MGTSDIQTIVEQIHALPCQLVLEFAGAGSLALWWLHRLPGSSRTILESTDRYSAASLGDLLGYAPDTFVAEQTVRAMTDHAYQRALALRDKPDVPVLGVACTAAIATDRPRRGQHHAFIMVRTVQETRGYALRLKKGARDRLGEETLVSCLLIRAIAHGCGLDAVLPLELLPGEDLHEQSWPDALMRLLNGEVQTVTVTPAGQHIVDQPFQGALLSGSFNPLHAGHTGLVATAEEVLGMPVCYELPVSNADKGLLDLQEVTRRLAQFQDRHSVILTHAPLFREKATLFPNSVFVVGFDTAIRLVAPRYYGDEAAMHAALAAIRDHGCRFLVAGRAQNGDFGTLDQVAVPPAFQDMFLALPEARFRVDLSSTQLREQHE